MFDTWDLVRRCLECLGMDIVYLGHSCFRIRGKNAVVITDPYDSEMVGLKLAKQQADVVTISHAHPDHNYLEAIKSKGETPVVVFDTPGEFESKEVDVRGWRTWHDDKQGALRGSNVVFLIEVDGVNIVHLGDLGHLIDDELIDQLGDVSVLMIPVGGHYTIDAAMAMKIVKKIEPRIVIPMHYLAEGMKKETFGELAELSAFLKEAGVDGTAVDKLTLQADNLPLETQTVVLKF